MVDCPRHLNCQRIDWIEFEYLYACLRQTIEVGPRCAECTDTVVDQVDLHSLRLAIKQQIRELTSHFTVFNDEEFNIDMVFCFANSGEHGLVRGRPILQQRDLVAYHKRTADDCLFERDLLIQDVKVAGFTLEFSHNGGASFRREFSPSAFELSSLLGVTIRQRPCVWQSRATGNAQQTICRCNLKSANHQL